MRAALVTGLAGPTLTPDEHRFLSETRPAGLILFARNCVSPDQIRALVGDALAAIGATDTLVLVDQEGGRVARLKPPHWRKAPPARVLGELYRRDPAKGLEATGLNSRLLAMDVASIGCDVDCLPVLDIAFPETHAVIGDRAYADTPEAVAALGRAASEGLMAEGVMAVIKHIPGHEATGIGLLEPLLVPVWVYLAWGDKPAWWTLAGGGLILLGLAIKYLSTRPVPKPLTNSPAGSKPAPGA